MGKDEVDRQAGRAQALGAFISHGARCEGKLLLEQENDKNDHTACST